MYVWLFEMTESLPTKMRDRETSYVVIPVGARRRVFAIDLRFVQLDTVQTVHTQHIKGELDTNYKIHLHKFYTTCFYRLLKPL